MIEPDYHHKKALEQFKKNDSTKVDWSLLPMKTIEEVIEVIAYGANKYERDNWKKGTNKTATDRLFAACQRHLADYQAGTEKDSESNLRHLAHAACNVIFLLYLIPKDVTNN